MVEFMEIFAFLDAETFFDEGKPERGMDGFKCHCLNVGFFFDDLFDFLFNGKEIGGVFEQESNIYVMR